MLLCGWLPFDYGTSFDPIFLWDCVASTLEDYRQVLCREALLSPVAALGDRMGVQAA